MFFFLEEKKRGGGGGKKTRFFSIFRTEKRAPPPNGIFAPLTLCETRKKTPPRVCLSPGTCFFLGHISLSVCVCVSENFWRKSVNKMCFLCVWTAGPPRIFFSRKGCFWSGGFFQRWGDFCVRRGGFGGGRLDIYI